MVSGDGVLKRIPVTDMHIATATSGAHLASLVKRRGGGGRGPVPVSSKYNEVN
jgi:hypothetical protein